MELEGVVHNGVLAPEDPTALPEGTRLRITAAPAVEPKSFGEWFPSCRRSASGLPADLAEQHEHYRLGTPKR
jgi:hypothetical protein